MACIPPNPRRVGYIVPIHGPLDGPLNMGSIYSNRMRLHSWLTVLPKGFCIVSLQIQLFSSYKLYALLISDQYNLVTLNS